MENSQGPSSQSPSPSESSIHMEDHSPSQRTTTQPPLPWFTESYFSHEPATAAARKVYIIILTSGGVVLILFALAVLSIYWGSLWHTPTHVHNLNAWVVDFDGSDVGQFVSRAVVASSGSPTTITWNAVSANLFPNGVQDLENAVVQNKAWAIIAINSNATETLNAAVVAADSAYTPNRTITVYVIEGRNENAYRGIIRPNIETVLGGATESFNTQYIQSIPGRSSNLTTLLVNAPELVSQPTSYTLVNTRPFDIPVATAVEFVGLIYMLILSFVVTMVHYGARIEVTHLEDRLTFMWLIIIRIVNPVIIYFFVSCFFCLLSLAFQVHFDRYHGSSGFVIYWMMSWLAMCAVGGALESMITILTPRFIPLFLLLWIIVNVSVCIFPLELLPGIYHYGYAMPFYNVQQTVRTILFGTRDQMGLNFGVQVAWIVVSWCTLVMFQYIRRRQSIRTHNAAIASASGSTLEKA
ncbi:hypothetical protein BJY52DRAFT_1252871 [Lactarius psammicola]|nr:hypothetical protein BJY52DRAFT_1252871 [Lactarius psammicola]